MKTVAEKWVLYTRHELGSPMEIGIHAGTDEPHLRAVAKENGLEVAGPLEHAYQDMAQKGVPHFLEIHLPVRGVRDGLALPQLKRSPAFKCMAMEFTRPIEEIGDAWMELGDMGAKAGMKNTHRDREVYHHMDCDSPELNRIELQLGIE